MNTTINNIKFVNAWVDAVNKSAGVKSVAEKLNLDIKQTSAKANALRKKGVNLPDMPRVRDDNNVDTLNAIIERKLEVA